jgi:Bbp16
MILDAFVQFTGGTPAPGNSDGKTDSPTTGAQTSSQIVDLGVGTVGNPAIPSFSAGGGARDIGVGDDPALKLLVQVDTTMAGGTSLGVSLQGAPDNGSGAPGTFTTYISGPVVLLANLLVGTRILEIDVPRLTVPTVPAPPRFLQLAYAIAGTFTGGGKINGNIVLDRNDQIYQANAVSGGYVPGVVVAN